MKRTTLAALAGILLLAAGCGGDEEADATPTVLIEGGDSAAAPTPDAAPDQTDEEAALAFAQCMRDNGVPEFPDPVVNADGSVELIQGGPDQTGFDADDQSVREGFDACGDLVAGASFLPGADRDQSEMEDDLLAFAQCLRDNGIDVDDPDLDSFGPGAADGADGGGPFGADFDPDDPATAEAIQVCQQDVFGATGGFRPGGN